MYKNCLFFLFFSCRKALLQKCCQNDVSEALRDPPGDPLGPSGEVQERPKMAPGAAQSTPRELWEAASETPGAPEAAQKPPGGHFGRIFEHFRTIFESFFGSGGSFARVSGHMFLTCSLPLLIVFRAPSAPLFAFSLLRSVAGKCHKSRQRQHRETRQKGRHRRRPESIKRTRGNAA